MNYKLVFSTLGKTMLIIAIGMALPMCVGFYYQENSFWSFLIPIIGLIVVGTVLSLLKSDEKNIYAKEGFVIVALAWIILSLIGAVPFVIEGCIPNYVDALFESVSGFSTTGASIVEKVEDLPRSMLFWRSCMHFIGGMGVLVFVIAILPHSAIGAMHIYRAESPGPSATKFVAKIRFTARILYAIYIGLTVIEALLLFVGGMPLFDSVCHAFSTAGTGGFGIKNNSIASYNNLYFEIVIAVFMFIFAINFNIFYLILIGGFAKIFKSEEFKIYVIMIFIATVTIALNLIQVYGTFWEALRYSFFQVTSISSTTGFSTADFNVWPEYSKAVILFLTIFGACAGSTGGGVKIARLGILFKSSIGEVRSLAKPRTVRALRFDGEVLESKRISNVRVYFIIWLAIIIISTLLLSIDSFGDLFSNITASITCLGNVGPGFGVVGPTCNYSGYNAFSKIILSCVMLMGRLEIFPIIVLVSPSTWRRK